MVFAKQTDFSGMRSFKGAWKLMSICTSCIYLLTSTCLKIKKPVVGTMTEYGQKCIKVEDCAKLVMLKSSVKCKCTYILLLKQNIWGYLYIHIYTSAHKQVLKCKWSCAFFINNSECFWSNKPRDLCAITIRTDMPKTVNYRFSVDNFYTKKCSSQTDECTA